MSKLSKADLIEKRVREVAEYVIETGATVRAAALEFGVSKSTIGQDLLKRLPKINPNLYNEVRAVLDENKALGVIYGGIATKRKWAEMANDI